MISPPLARIGSPRKESTASSTPREPACVFSIEPNHRDVVAQLTKDLFYYTRAPCSLAEGPVLGPFRRPLLTALVPGRLAETGVTTVRGQISGDKTRWGTVTLLGLAIGAVLFAAQMSEGNGSIPPFGRRVFIVAVFMGLATAGLLIAHALLGKPLGLGQQSAERDTPA